MIYPNFQFNPIKIKNKPWHGARILFRARSRKLKFGHCSKGASHRRTKAEKFDLKAQEHIAWAASFRCLGIQETQGNGTELIKWSTIANMAQV